MKVLSLFDGISCARVALDRLGINCQYLASEIDEDCISVSKSNYPDIVQLGDVTEIKLGVSSKIDLLIGGSPCQGFSISGKGLNFDDERSKLFFEYVRIFKECRPKYFILENVFMKQEWQDIISEHLGIKPILINSSLVSAQVRKRLYWTNIPTKQPDDKKIVFEDILDKDSEYITFPERSDLKLDRSIKERSNATIRLGGFAKQGQGQRVYSIKGKSVCLTALGGGWGAKTGIYWDGKHIRKPTQIELERLQTLPDGYTRVLNYSKAQKAIGNSFTVDVICHILKSIREMLVGDK